MQLSRRQERVVGGILLALFSLGIFYLQFRAPISTTGNDSRYSLYVTQALLTTGSIRLDESLEAFGADIQQDYRLQVIDGHTYYFFPLGSSLYALPIVWAANQAGYRVDSLQHESALQQVIAAAVSALIFLTTFAILRSCGVLWWSLLAALTVMLGSSFTSTLGTGLWALNFATLFVMLSLWLMIRFDSEHTTTVHPVWLGSFLFAAYLARPTTAVFILLVFAYLFWRDRRELAATAVTALAWLLLFILYSRTEMGLWLPAYYLPQRLAGTNVPAPVVLYGLLFSPGRGLFIFSPIFLLPLGLALWKWRGLRHEPLFWLSLAWISLHVGSLLRFEHWWGGHSFGPRLLTEIVPAFVLLTAVISRHWPLGIRPSQQRWLATAGAITAVFSIYVNAYAGLYNPATAQWNAMPHIDNAPQYLFDWRYPQFAATQAANCTRLTDFHLQRLANRQTRPAPYQIGTTIDWTNAAPDRTYSRTRQWYLPSFWRQPAAELPAIPANYQLFMPQINNGEPQDALLIGWVAGEGTAMTAVCPTAQIAFRFSDPEPDAQYEIHLLAQSPGEQTITVLFNDTPLSNIQPGPALTEWVVPLDGRLLRRDSLGLLSFATADGSPLALTLQTLTILPAGGAP